VRRVEDRNTEFLGEVSTTLFFVTVGPTSPQTGLFSDRKSFWGSVTNIAVFDRLIATVSLGMKSCL
jgi:hypothetical protein